MWPFKDKNTNRKYTCFYCNRELDIHWEFEDENEIILGCEFCKQKYENLIKDIINEKDVKSRDENYIHEVK